MLLQTEQFTQFAYGSMIRYDPTLVVTGGPEK